VITVKQTRTKGGTLYEQPTLTFSDPLEAVAHLAKTELGWGGQIVDVGEGRIKVETRVLHDVDTAIFEGPSEEMKPLFELVYFYMEASEKHGDLIVDQVVDYTQRFPDGMGGTPLIFSMIAPLLVGGNRLKVAVMLACGVKNENDVKVGLEAEVEDLVAAVQLSHEGQCSFREALAL